MAARRIFMTGYPGFLGRWQVRSILDDDPGVEFTFLVQEKFLGRALEDIAELATSGKAAAGSLRAVAGDVTDPRLGLAEEEYRSVAAWATEVWHMAGAFDLFIPEGLSRKINYWGVRHVVDFCESCGSLSHLVHFSSVVVHAEREDRMFEDELDAGQELVNNYFMSKFWGEMEVRRAMERGLPAIIIRPAGVLGDSRTGESDKFDNVFIMMKVFHLLHHYKVPPVGLGNGKMRPNFVPVDFVVDAVTAITRSPGAVGRCFQVVDHDPPNTAEMLDEIWLAVCGKRPRFSIPAPVVDYLAMHCGWLFKVFGIPPDSMTYMNHVGSFDDANAREILEGAGISCPRIQEYYPKMYAFWLANRNRKDMYPKM